MKIRGAAEAIGFYLGYDTSEIREARYHYGRTGTLQIFVIGDDYMTACKSTRKAPPRPTDYQYDWILLAKDHCGLGWDIYECDPTKESQQS